MLKLIQHLERIARKNKDSFSYRIEIVPGKNEAKYSFWVEEIYDHHVFLSTEISDINDSQSSIDEDMLKKACKNWGYIYVD